MVLSDGVYCLEEYMWKVTRDLCDQKRWTSMTRMEIEDYIIHSVHIQHKPYFVHSIPPGYIVLLLVFKSNIVDINKYVHHGVNGEEMLYTTSTPKRYVHGKLYKHGIRCNTNVSLPLDISAGTVLEVLAHDGIFRGVQASHFIVIDILYVNSHDVTKYNYFHRRDIIKWVLSYLQPHWTRHNQSYIYGMNTVVLPDIVQWSPDIVYGDTTTLLMPLYDKYHYIQVNPIDNTTL